MNNILPTLFLFDEYPINISKIFKQNNPLKYVYGTVRNKWSFNYDSYYKEEDKEFVNEILKILFDNNYISIINFSKTKIEKEELKDAYCNYLLDMINEYKGELIVGSDILYDYIKSKYPNIPLISSVNIPIDKFQTNENPEKELELYNKLLAKYDKVVIRPEYNKYLEEQKIPDKAERIIVIPNNACKVNCQEYNKCRELDNSNFICPRVSEKLYESVEKSLTNISMLSNAQIDTLSSLGIKNFMLKDNKQSPALLFNYYNYILFKRELPLTIFENLETQIRNDTIEEKYVSERHIEFFRNGLQKRRDVLNL
jgi:hypothetical protein